MCNKQNYSFKKVYIISFIITVVSFIAFFLYSISRGSVIKYDKQQNTSTVLEMINYSSIGDVPISNEAHIESIEYMSDFHNYKLKIKYLENGESKKVIIRMNNKDSIIHDYFNETGTSVNNSIFSLIVNIYKFIFLTLFIIFVIKISIIIRNRGSAK